MKQIRIFKIELIVFVLISLFSCKKLAEVNPPPILTGENVFTSDVTSIAVLNGLYGNLSSYSFYSPVIGSISKYSGLSADELLLVPNSDDLSSAYFSNNLSQTLSSKFGGEIWPGLYNGIYTCNKVLEGISKTNLLSPPVKQQLEGEAKFLRAFFYFYLVNLYGDVPLVLSTDYEVNRQLSKVNQSLIYKQIVIDLEDAKNLLSADYLNGNLVKYSANAERVRPTKWAASALLARAYLYIGEWAKSETESSNVISQTVLFDLTSVPLNKVFLKNSKESIWQLQPVVVNQNSPDALGFLIPSAGPDPFGVNIYLSGSIMNSFEPGDMRKSEWIKTYSNATANYPYSYKYKNSNIPSTNPVTPPTEYSTILRLGEQYLIRAEARVQQNNIAGAANDLNVLRTRARTIATPSLPNPLPPIDVTLTKEQMLQAVLHERQVELFTEWGHRWLDLKRTKNIDAIMAVVTPAKGGNWQNYKQWYPIPFDDIQRNPNLVQTSGY